MHNMKHFSQQVKTVMRLLLFVAIFAALFGGSRITALAAPSAQAGANPVLVTVSDTQGGFASGLNVYVFSGTTYMGLSGVTDTNGQVTFNLADNSYNFRADLNGTQFFSGGGTGGTDTCTIPGCTADSVTVTIPVVVTVSDTNATPQEGLSVYAFSGTTYAGISSVTDVDGHVSFTLLPGDYNFRADLNGTQFFSGGASGTNTCTVPGCTADSVTVTIPVVVTVSDTNAAPQEGLSVYAFSGTTYAGISGVTAVNGQVSFTLLPGDYNFRADKNGTQFFSGGGSGVNTCTVPGCTADGVTVTADAVLVTVSDTNSAAVQGVPVYVYSGTTYTNFTANTDAAGQVSFTLPSGSYNFRADLNGTQFFSGGASGVDSCTVPSCVSDAVTVTSPVVVTVQDTSSATQTGISVYAFNGATYTGKTGVTDGSGQVSFTLVPGDYNFRADLNGTQFFSGGASGVNTCNIPSSGLNCTADSVTVTIPMVVTVVDTNNVPQAGISVYAFNGTTYSGKTGVTDGAGHVSFTLLPGDYNFRADFNGNQYFSGGASGTNTCTIPGCTTDSVTVPALAAPNASLPLTTCSLAGSTRTCELYAMQGTLPLPDGSTVPFWGYSLNAAGPAGLPGPDTAIIALQGETVVVNLHNVDLPDNTSLLLQGQSLVPDRTGIATGGVTSYTFTANKPGTFIYEAGLTANGPIQVAMGLYGALIVRPSNTGQAYDAASTAFTDEALAVLGEIDPALNNNANPASFDLRDFAPKYYLINGKAYADTTNIMTSGGNNLLLRYVNGGVQYHSMALLGIHQTVISNDGSPLAYSHRMVAETIGPGQSADVIITVPVSAPQGSKFPLYDGNLMLHNSSAGGFGGMLTFLTVGTPPVPGADVARTYHTKCYPDAQWRRRHGCCHGQRCEFRQ